MLDILIFAVTIIIYFLYTKNDEQNLHSLPSQESESIKLDPTKIIRLEKHPEGYFAYRFTDYGFLGHSQKLDILLESLWNKNPTLQIIVEDNHALEKEMLNVMNSLASQTEPYPNQVQK